jgi:MoxR-like ATPase
MTNTRENPYVGPHAFEPKDQKKFAGRDRDITALYRLLIAERIVLLFSPSGAGKSSLVNAGLLPRMIEKGFKILPVVRVNLPLPGELTAKGETNR